MPSSRRRRPPLSEDPGYDPTAVAAFFDAYGEREWARLEASTEGRVKLAIHRKFLSGAVQRGMRVADVGCGPGRFAIDLLRLGAQVTLVDISRAQLSLARLRIDEAGLAGGVEGYYEGDVCNLRQFPDSTFDCVLCFGGAISYVRERHNDALQELVRITKPGGTLLLSVMSLWGTLMLIGTLDAAPFLAEIGDHLPWDGTGALPEVLLTRAGSREFHQPMALFSSHYLAGLLNGACCDVVALAASNPVSRAGLPLAAIGASADAESALTRLEVAICESPAVVDTGTHLIAVARKRLT